MKIEKIYPANIPELVNLARQAHSESKYKEKLPFSELAMSKTFAQYCLPDEFGIKAVSEHQIIGFFLATITGMIFTDKPVGMETTYWVKPEKRGSKCFFLLMMAFNEWAEKQNIPQFCIPHFAIDNSKTYSALEKLGFVQVGRIYARNI